MKKYSSDQIRNVVLLSQKGNGKTTLAEAALYCSGAISRMGKVEDGNTQSDSQPEEIARQASTGLAVLACEWKDAKINLIDVPGDPEFGGDIASGLWAADLVVILIDGASGIEVGTELAWQHAIRNGMPVLFAINRLDRDNIEWSRLLDSLAEQFGPIAPVQLPHATGSRFTGLVDLLGDQSYHFGNAGSEMVPTPAEVANAAAAGRAELVETIASQDEDLIEKFLLDEPISTGELTATLARATAERELFPVVAVSAVNNFGVDLLLNILAALTPPPKPSGKRDTDSAVAFKTIVDPQLGHLTYLRVCSGHLTSSHSLHNVSRSTDERIGHVFAPVGKSQSELPQAEIGDIVRIAKLSHTLTGDTLTSERGGDQIAGPKMPAPSMALAVSPETKSDVDKLSTALHRLTEQDPSLHVTRGEGTGETLLWGLGDTHLNAALDMIRSKFGAQIETSTPKVPYRETVRRASSANGRFKRQSGGRGQFGDVSIILEPLSPEEGDFEFVSQIVGGSISRNYVPAVEKGVISAMAEGIRAGYPVVGCRVRLTDGKEHAVDSSDQAFQQAGVLAFRAAAQHAQPTLLEPIHELRISVPEAFTGAIVGDLNSRRGHILGTDQADSYTVVLAEAPLAETQRYAVDLKQLTQGRGGFESKFLRYQEMPEHLQKAVISAAAGAS